MHVSSCWLVKVLTLIFDLICSLGRLFEDGLPLLTNSSVQNRLLRINEDYRRFMIDSKLWNDLMNNSSRPVQWNGYNLSGAFSDIVLRSLNLICQKYCFILSTCIIKS